MYAKISLVHILAILGSGVCYQQDETLTDAYPYYYPSGKGLTVSLFSTIFDISHCLKRLKPSRDPTQSIMGKVECVNYASIFLTNYH